MRILFLTDIHENFQGIEKILQSVKADLYLLAGDLVYRIFPTQRTAWKFMQLQERLSGMIQGPTTSRSLLDLASRLAQGRSGDPSSRTARDYLRLCELARAHMLTSYQRLKDILQKHTDLNVRVLPGNYDMDLAHSPLSHWNLHLQFLDLAGIRFAGYGGANVLTPGVPAHLQLRFREKSGSEGPCSEPLEFFRSTGPHVLVVHQPPYGLLDRLEGRGPAGSMGIRQYLDDARPLAVLCGHIHHRWGALRIGGTWCVNPSNFGAVMEVSGVRRGGYFLDLGLDTQGVSWAMIRQLWKDRILDVVHYEPRGEEIREIILDEVRFRAMGGFVKKHKHARPFGRLQHIRSFFLSHETPQSKVLVSRLRTVYRTLEAEGINVAFDLLGSLGFGMAWEGSDMDLVVYLRGLGCNADEQDVCRTPEPLSRVIKKLADQGIKVEICDSIDLDRIEEAIRKKDKHDGQLQRFVFYRAVCRPVNLRLIKEVENKLLGQERFRRSMEKRLQEHLKILVSSGRHMESWDKYKRRLKESGVDMPPRIQEALRKYLGL